MTTGEGTGRLSTSETARRLLESLNTPRVVTASESSVTISTSAKHGTKDDPRPRRLHSWDITVRGEDEKENARKAARLDDELAAKYAHELEEDDDLAAKLAASIVAQQEGGTKQ